MRRPYKRQKLLLFILLLVISVILCGCHDADNDSSSTASPSVSPAPFAPNKLQPEVSGMNTGSSKKLTGKCLFVNIFISDEEASFKDGEQSECIEQLTTALDYLSEQAGKYGASFEAIYDKPDINIDYHADFSFPIFQSDSKAEHHEWTRKILDDVFDAYDLETVIKSYGADNVSYIFYIRNDTSIFAITEGMISGYDKEIVVVGGVPRPNFVGSAGGIQKEGADILIYERNILELFGAKSLRDTKQHLSLAEEMFPSEIMLYNDMLRKDATIDEVTAYLIGWSNELDEQYHVFIEE